jgi:hypothetical protein
VIRLIDILAVPVRDNAGALLANGMVTFYEAGTTTLKTVYQDFEQTTAHPNPATLDAIGRLDAYASGRVKLVLADWAGATIRTIDNVGNEDSDIALDEIEISAGAGLTTTADGEASIAVDGSTLEISAGELRVKTSGIMQAQLGTRIIAATSTGATGEIVRSSAIANENTQSTTPSDITGGTVTLTTKGRPVFVYLEPAVAATESYVRIDSSGSAITEFLGYVIFLKGADVSAKHRFGMILSSSSSAFKMDLPSCVFRQEFLLDAGTYTFTLQGAVTNASARVTFSNVRICAYER